MKIDWNACLWIFHGQLGSWSPDGTVEVHGLLSRLIIDISFRYGPKIPLERPVLFAVANMMNT